MPNQINPLLISKFILWIAVIVAATLLLRRRKVTSKLRLVFLIGGVLLFGLVYGLLTQGGLNPNPVFSVRNLLTAVLVKHQLLLPIVAMLVILLLAVFVSNKSICGWGCQLGLLQRLAPSCAPTKVEAAFLAFQFGAHSCLCGIGSGTGHGRVGLDWPH